MRAGRDTGARRCGRHPAAAQGFRDARRDQGCGAVLLDRFPVQSGIRELRDGHPELLSHIAQIAIRFFWRLWGHAGDRQSGHRCDTFARSCQAASARDSHAARHDAASYTPRRSGDAEYDSAHPAGHAAKRSGYQDGAGHRGAGQTNHAAPSRRAQAAGATALSLFPRADVLFTLLLGVSVLLHEVAGHPPHRSSRRVLLAMALVDVADFLQHIGPQRGIELQRFLKIGIGVRPIVRRAPERPPEFRHLWDVAYRSLLDCRSECAVV